MEVAVVIPARFASERLPGKPLVDICGKPMIVHVLERARAARGVSRTVVATDDERVVAAVRAAGGDAVMTPVDCPSGSDRCARAARALPGIDVVINVQGDEPLLDPVAIETLIGAFADPAVQMATLARPLAPAERENRNVVKVVRDLSGDALFFSRAPIGYPRDGKAAPEARAHLGIYGFRAPFLQRYAALAPTPLELAEKLEQLRVLEHGLKIRVLDTDTYAFGVDTPEDLEKARHMLERKRAPR